MDALVQEAAYGKGTLFGFATKEVNLSSTEIIRGLAQCTPDIVGPRCYRCLTAALRIRDTWANTMVFLPSCLLRYDLYETVALLPPPSPPASTLKGSFIALIVVPSVAFIVLAGVGGFCFWRHRHYLQARVPLQTHGLPQYNFSQVRQMTNNFDKEVGRGGFRVVYSGTLLDDDREVAVKLLKQNNASNQA